MKGPSFWEVVAVAALLIAWYALADEWPRGFLEWLGVLVGVTIGWFGFQFLGWCCRRVRG